MRLPVVMSGKQAEALQSAALHPADWLGRAGEKTIAGALKASTISEMAVFASEMFCFSMISRTRISSEKLIMFWAVWVVP